MLIQKALRTCAVLKRHVIGAHPIIQWFIDRLQLREIISTYIPQDGRLSLGVEQAICVLVHNILSSPSPMYEVAEWVGPLSEESLGLEIGEGALIQDDRIGNALDSFYEGRHKDVFFRLALRAIKVFDLDCSQIHQDTTTITFSGRYDEWSAHERLAFGHNKDHRPDLKQLVLGTSVTADGSVPLVHQIYDGNQSDDRLHPKNHQHLRKVVGHSDFVYVADCKLASEENLSKLAAVGGIFVTVMPRTWKEDKEFKRRVLAGQIRWSSLLLRKNSRKPGSKVDHYELADSKYQTAQGYRLLWIRSSQKAEQDADTRCRQIEKSLEELRELQGKLNRYSLKNKENIEREILKILRGNQCQKRILWDLHTHRRYQIRHGKRGRPSSIDRGKQSWDEHYSLSFQLDSEKISSETLTDGIFPLITNTPEENYEPKRVLEIYKFQPFLEKRHAQLKTWQEATPVLLKKSERVVAYLHVHILALTVSTLIERSLRRAMKKAGIVSLPIYPEGRPCKYPTLFDIVRLFNQVERYEVEEGERVTLFPAQLTPLQKQVLKLLEVPSSLYK